jgi:sugar lactone lactonase YvrE
VTISRNPLTGWRLDRNEITNVGIGLVRPECVLAGADGTIWTADGRGGVMRIETYGTQRHLIPRGISLDAPTSIGGGAAKRHLPNGIALMADGAFVIADLGKDAVLRLGDDGELTPLLEAIDGVPLGKVNFALADRRGGIWVSVSTRQQGAADTALKPDTHDGYILHIDDGSARIVADGLGFANEIKFDRTSAGSMWWRRRHGASQSCPCAMTERLARGKPLAPINLVPAFPMASHWTTMAMSGARSLYRNG